MLDNYKYQAKRSVVAAQEAARGFGHDHIGTEHLLLGLVREKSPAKAAFAELGVTDEAVTAQIEDTLGTGEATVDAIPFDLEAKAALDQAAEEAAALGQQTVGAEHLAFAILGERESGAVMLLEKLGVDPEAVRPAVMQQLKATEKEEDGTAKKTPGKEIGSILVEQGSVDQAQLEDAREGARDKLLGRALIDLGLIEERDLVRALATQIGMDFIDLNQFPVEPWAVQLIPPAAAWRHHVIAIGERGGKLLLAMSNPTDNHAIDDIRVMTNRQVEPVVAMASDIERALRANMGTREQAEADQELPVTSRTWYGESSVGPAEPWKGPEDSVIGTPVDLGTVLAVTDTGVFVAISDVIAYPNGFGMTVTLRRKGAPRADKWFEAVSWQHRWSGSGIPELSPRALRVGVEFPDGARVDNLSFRDMPTRRPPTPSMISLGAEGTGWRVDVQYWIWPLPPGGEANFFCEWPSEGISLTQVPFDSAVLHEAAERAHVLWDEG